MEVKSSGVMVAQGAGLHINSTGASAVTCEVVKGVIAAVAVAVAVVDIGVAVAVAVMAAEVEVEEVEALATPLQASNSWPIRLVFVQELDKLS